MASFLGCVAPGANIDTFNAQDKGSPPWPGNVYHPKLPTGISTLDAAKKDLAALLKFSRLVDNTGIRYYGALDFNKPADRNNLAGYLMRVQAYIIVRDTRGEFIYTLPKHAITVLDDRINVGPVFALFYADLLESRITVEKIRYDGIRTSWLGTDQKIWHDTDPSFGNLAIQHRPVYMRPYVINCSGLISFFFKKQTDAEKFADDLFFIQQTLKKQDDERRALFESRAAAYRALKVKPSVTEEQRKFIVRANALSQGKEYDRAIDMYKKAVDLDPVSYPEAYFNLALLSAQVHRFNMAVSYMKQYLALVPDAKDARGAQDKIYEWEMRAEEKQQ